MSGRYRRGRRRTWTSGFRRSRGYPNMRSSMVKRSRGNLRAANNQNDTSDVVINLMKSVDVGINGGFTYQMDGEQPVNHSKISQGTCALNIYDLLRKSDFYNSYANMYDQFRITSIKVKITPVRWSSYDQQQSAINAPETVVGNIQTSEGRYKIRYQYNPAYSTLIEVEDPLHDGQTMQIRVRNPAYANPDLGVPTVNAPLYFGINPLSNQTIQPGGEGVYVANAAGNYDNIDLDPDMALFEVAQTVGGEWFYVAMILINFVAVGLAVTLNIQSSVGRVLFAMGRDNMIFGSKFLSKISKFQTPMNAILLSMVLSIVIVFALDLDIILRFVNFGAVTAFAAINLSVVIYFFIKKKNRDYFRSLIAPLFGFVVCAFVWSGFDKLTMLTGLVWVVVGIIVGLIKTKGYKEKPKDLEI